MRRTPVCKKEMEKNLVGNGVSREEGTKSWKAVTGMSQKGRIKTKIKVNGKMKEESR